MRERIKIALYLPSLQGGGTEKNVLTLARNFASQGYSVDLVLSKAEGPLMPDVPENIPIINLKASRPLKSIPGLVKYFKQNKPTIFFSALTYRNLVAIIAKKLSGSKTRLFVSERSTVSKNIKTRRKLTFLLIRLLYPLADKVIAVSHSVADDLVKTTKINKDIVEVIYNPVVTDNTYEKAKEKIDDQWFYDNGKPIILGIGRLVKVKDFSTLIKAFNKVNKNYPSRLIILGEGEERNNLESLVMSLNLNEDDVLLPGFVMNPYKYLSKANLFVLSSIYEGLPTVLIEALALGIPVVSTNCPGGSKEIMENGKWGKLVPVQNDEELAKAMFDTLTSKTDKEALINRGQFFNINASISNYKRLLGLKVSD